MNKFLLAAFSLLLSLFARGQHIPYDLPYYDFIHYNKNIIHMPSDSSQFTKVFKAICQIASKGRGELTILHLGDSHIQADYFSGRIRKHFHELSNGGIGSRGFVFPYNIAKTNNPANYYQKYKGSWYSCKNTQRNSSCNFGVGGMNIYTNSPAAEILFYQRGNEDFHYTFDRIKLFHSMDKRSFSPELGLGAKYTKHTDSVAGYTEFILNDFADSVLFTFRNDSSYQNRIEILGYSLESSEGGLTYSATGVNGADAEAWLRCSYLQQQIKSLSPAMVIVSLGTNDSYPKYFNEDIYYQNLTRLIQKIKTAVPEAAIMLTTAADNYRYRRYLNRNTQKAEKMSIRVANENGCAFWNLNEVMGGLNSILYWQRYGLAGRDRLHYTKKGYQFQGDLFFDAFLKSFNQYFDSQQNF